MDLAVGMESTVLPTLVLAAGIILSYEFAGLYGVAIAAAGMMATTAMQLAIDAFGPIADNAGGIAEMSQLPEEVRQRTDNLMLLEIQLLQPVKDLQLHLLRLLH